jgi:hypothetical protein
LKANQIILLDLKSEDGYRPTLYIIDGLAGSVKWAGKSPSGLTASAMTPRVGIA